MFYVGQFSGSKTNSVKSYLKPSIRENNQGCMNFNGGTTDIKFDKNPQTFAQSTVNLARNVVGLIVSNIIPLNG